MCGNPMQPIVTIFGRTRDSTEVNNRPKVCIDRFKRFEPTQGKSWGLLQETAMARSTL